MFWYIISFLALSLLLKYYLFSSSTHVLTSSIDVGFVLSTWILNINYLTWYISGKYDCHKTKNVHINGTLGLKCSHPFLPWPWSRYFLGYVTSDVSTTPTHPVDLGSSHFILKKKHNDIFSFSLISQHGDCRRTLGPYPKENWQRYLMEYGVPRPQLVHSLWPNDSI